MFEQQKNKGRNKKNCLLHNVKLHIASVVAAAVALY